MPAPRNIRHIQLPSGRTIEVVIFADDGHLGARGTSSSLPAGANSHRGGGSAPAHADTGRSATEPELHICPRCAGELVHPVDWRESGVNHWRVLRRCPECEWSAEGRFSQDLVERFDVHLDEGAEALLHDLQELAHANMAADIDRFLLALQDDHVLPGDF